MKKKKLLFNILLIIFILIFLISSYKIINYFIDQKSIEKQINEINDKVTIDENTGEEIIIENEEKKNNPYWDYIKMNLINVDFKELKNINKDVKGWISVNGTNINYPFVQTNNNEYYLNHAFNKSYNAAGWVFMDYRNNISNENEKNTILYAHGMKNKTMFGSLRDISKNGWLKNKDNFIIKLSTEYENTMWQVFSLYTIPTTSDYIETNFKNNEFVELTTKLINRSIYNFNTSVTDTDRILTLSTCNNKDEKVVLHAKLIKKEKRMN